MCHCRVPEDAFTEDTAEEPAAEQDGEQDAERAVG